MRRTRPEPRAISAANRQRFNEQDHKSRADLFAIGLIGVSLQHFDGCLRQHFRQVIGGCLALRELLQIESGSLRGGNFSGRAAFAYRVEKSSGPETYQNAPERSAPECDRTHNRAGLEPACSETVKGELPDVPSMYQ